MPKANFAPEKQGFRFINYFTNVIASLPGIGQISTYGRCGGMCYTILDHMAAHMPLPNLGAVDFAETDGVPPDGHPLADYIYQRQLDSFMVLSAVKFLSWTVSKDGDSWFSKGVSRLCKEDEFAKLKTSIDSNQPATIGLITARNLTQLGANHQVLAYGYEESANLQVVYIYDVNYAGRELKLVSRHDELGWHEDVDGAITHWRGWFVQDYSPKRPPTDLNRPTLINNKAEASGKEALKRGRATRVVQLKVALSRITFNNEADADATDDVALEFNVNGQVWRWPSRGLKTVEDGRSYRLSKVFEVAVPTNGALEIAVRPALSETLAQAVQAGWLESAESRFSLFDEAAGEILLRFTAQDQWGKGKHTARSSGTGGAYALGFEVAL
jgi:hypothetical protein